MDVERKIREGIHTMKGEYMKKNFRYMFRVTLQMMDGSMGEVESTTQKNERAARGLDGEYPHSNNHIAIFEC